MKNLNRQRTVTIAETNEVVVKKKTQFCWNSTRPKENKQTAFWSLIATNSGLEILSAFSYKVYEIYI